MEPNQRAEVDAWLADPSTVVDVDGSAWDTAGDIVRVG